MILNLNNAINQLDLTCIEDSNDSRIHNLLKNAQNIFQDLMLGNFLKISNLKELK